MSNFPMKLILKKLKIKKQSIEINLVFNTKLCYTNNTNHQRRTMMEKRKSSLRKISVLTLAIVFVVPTIAFANIQDLTIQEATTRAISNSRGIRDAQDNITLIQEGEQRIRDIIWYTPMMPHFMFLDMQANMLRFETSRAVSLSSIEAQRETLGFIVTSHFSNILTAQNELEIFDQNISLLERDVAAVNLMQSLGMASNAQLNQLTTAKRQAQSNRANLELSIESAFRELNRIMGSRQNEIYNLIFEPSFTSVRDINLDRYISLHQSNSLQIENAQNQLAIARFEHDNHANRFDPLTGISQPGGVTRNERAIAVTQANREVTNAREQVENNVVDLYNNILNLEIAIEAMQLQLGILEQSVSTQELRFSVGQITAIELDRDRLSLAELNENIRRQKVNHYLLSMQLTNPNITLGF